jgi:excinuclease ABC subunit C
MKKAAAAQEYERAAQLRDLLSDLRRTTKKVNRFERLPYSLPLALDSERDLTELGQALGLSGPPQRIEGFDISNISGTFAVASLVSFREGRPDRSNYRRFKIKSVEGQDDFAAIAEVVRRRYTRLLRESKVRPPGEPHAQSAEGGEAIPKELQQLVNEIGPTGRTNANLQLPVDAAAADICDHQAPGERSKKGMPSLPDLILIDGGKGQLNAACGELEKLGLEKIPIIGLAKEFEEIYRPGSKEPLRLSHESGALKLLQRVRDESHRLANTYNAELRLRKISESILDEFPNIGQRRKAALLKKFGSVQRMRIASVEQISEVPGFGGKAAGELKTFLEARSSSPLPKPTEAPNSEAPTGVAVGE